MTPWQRSFGCICTAELPILRLTRTFAELTVYSRWLLLISKPMQMGTCSYKSNNPGTPCESDFAGRGIKEHLRTGRSYTATIRNLSHNGVGLLTMIPPRPGSRRPDTANYSGPKTPLFTASSTLRLYARTNVSNDRGRSSNHSMSWS